jgi:putative glycerol-1-phosphate prenyltransferase
MNNIYSKIIQSKSRGQKLLAILLDPDKINWENLGHLILKINESPATHIFIGGSQVFSGKIDELIQTVKQNCTLPIVLFPGNPSQISDKADGILFLSLISGRNPDFLIGHQVKAAPILKKSNLEIIPTGYILIDGGSETAVSVISKTQPLSTENSNLILATAQAGEMLGKKLIYLEAGSGAKNPVPTDIIALISQNIEIPLIVGGGIVTLDGIKKAHECGADLVVIGTAFENNPNFFNHD